MRTHHSLESLERRTLLAVTFTPGPYTTPSNRPDVEIAPLPGAFPESVTKINPNNAANIVTGVLSAMGYSNNAYAMFTGPLFFPLPPGAMNSGDPDLAFDAQSRLFWSEIVKFPDRQDVGIVEVHPTTGAVLAGPFLIPNTTGIFDDKSFIAADANPASPYANNIYAVWSRLNATPGEYEVLFSRSTNQGQSWTTPIQLSDFNGPDNIPNNADDEGWCWPSDVNVAPNGDVYATYHSQPELNDTEVEVAGFRTNPSGTTGKTFVMRSTDGGQTFGQKVEAFPAGTSDLTFNTQDAGNGGTTPGTQFTWVGSVTPYVLPDPVRPGNVYIINADDPDNVHGSGDDADIVIARSTDNGQTWTRSTVIAGPSNSFQIFPFTAIDRLGNIVLSWLDNRRGFTNSDGRFLVDFMATYSTDGGITWAPEFRLSDVAFDPDPNPVILWGGGNPPTTRIGEYFGIDVLGNTAHVTMDANYFIGGNPAGQAFTYTNFAIAGALTVTGDDNPADGPVDDVISINPLPGNPNFIEVVVNGERQYAGLFEGLSGITIDAGGGTDTINISNTGASLPITILPSSGDDAVNINTAGVGATNVIFSNTQRLGALTIGAGGIATLPVGGSKVLTVTSLNMTGSAKLDLSDGDMIVDYTGSTPLAAIQPYLTSGYNNAAWNGSGINSATAAVAGNTALGFAEATDLFSSFPAPFSGQSVDDTSILIKYTFYGDAKLDGNVNLDDFNRLAANFGQSPRRWSQGDFTFNELTNLDDFNRLAANFGVSAKFGGTSVWTLGDEEDIASVERLQR